MRNKMLGFILLSLGTGISAVAYAANTAPIAIPQAVEATEDQALPITLEGVDSDSDPLTYKIATKPLKGVIALPVGSNLATYTPKANYYGSDKFTFSVTDGKSTPKTATVSIMVKPVNDPPVPQAQSVTLAEDTLNKAITLKAVDVDSSTLTYNLVTVPEHGRYTQVGTRITYTPFANYFGADSFTFTATDSAGLTAAAPATVNLTITPLNDAPVANALAVTVPSSGTTPITLSGSDVDGNTLTYAIATLPKPKGTLSAIVNGNQVNYTPKTGVTSDSFKFTVKDGKLTSPAATVTVTVRDTVALTDPFLLACFGGNIPSAAALSSLTTFTCNNLDLSSANLAQLAQLPNLRTLDLAYTKLPSLSGLASLTKLTSLNVAFNEITDISALAGMTELQYLNLGFNKISSISALSGLNKLQELHVDANNLSSISTLSGKKTLTKLYLDDNQLTSILELATLPNLTRLGLGYNQISNITALSGLTALQVLVLDSNNINTLTSLSNLTALQQLYLRGNLLVDSSPLARLTNLQVLELGFNQLKSVTPLANLTRLTQLGLDFNELDTVSALSRLTSLKSLDLEHNQLVTTAGIPSMSGLNSLLRLQGNRLLDDDINLLSPMGNSFNLRLEDNCLASIALPSTIKVFGKDWQFPAAQCGGTAPVAFGKTSEILQNTATTILLDAYDPNGDALKLTYKLENIAVTGGVLKTANGAVATVGNLTSNELRFEPSNNYLGSGGTFKFSATDADGEKSQVVTVQLRVIHPMLATCFGASIPSDATLQTMTRLDSCNGKSLTDISALPFYFPNVQTLFLGGNAITDYTPLASLPSLTGLSLKGNNLDSAALQVLSGLHNMTILELDECQLDNTDITWLSGLTKLTDLYLNKNNITDISQLSNLTGLVVLKLADNSISDLTPLSGMWRLNNLILNNNKSGDNQASNMHILSNLTTLTYFEFEKNGITDVTSLAALNHLQVLSLRNNRLLTADPLKAMTQALAMYVAGNCLTGTALSGWPANITLDSAGAQRAAVGGVCPAPP